jgi:hypothetical protein
MPAGTKEAQAPSTHLSGWIAETNLNHAHDDGAMRGRVAEVCQARQLSPSGPPGLVARSGARLALCQREGLDAASGLSKAAAQLAATAVVGSCSCRPQALAGAWRSTLQLQARLQACLPCLSAVL